MKISFTKFILCLLLIALTSEILVRISLPNYRPDNAPDRVSDHPYIRKDWVPGFKTTYQVGIDSQTEPVPFGINEFGFRSSSMKTMEKPTGTSRIFFLGESTTESVTLPEEETFPFLTEKKLNFVKAPERFECINAAMSGNLAADSLVTLIYKVMYYQPNVIVVMHAINDLRYGAVPTFDPIKRNDFDRSFYFGGFSEKGGIWGWFRSSCKRSYLLTFLKRLTAKGDSGPSIGSKWQNRVAERQRAPVSAIQKSKALEDFLKNLSEMVYVACGHQVRIILMTEPCIYQEKISEEIDNKLWMGYLPKPGINLSNDFLNREMRRFNDAILELRNDGMEVIDLEKEIPKTLDYFYDDVHLTAKGAAKAAQVIADYLLNAPKPSAAPTS